MRAYSLFIIIFSMAMVVPSFASEKEDVKKGNILYNKGDYPGAAKLYEKAAMEKSDSGIPELNRGAALYKDGVYNKAIQSFNKSIASGRADLIQAADYNIGNSTYRIGVLKDNADKEKKNIKKTAEVYWAALQYYKRAMDLDPGDKDAKFNYEFVARKLEELSPLFQIKQEDEKKKEDKKDKKDEQNKEDQSNQGQDDQQKDKEQKDQQDQQEKDNSGQDQEGGSRAQDEKEPQGEDQKKDKGEGSGESEQKDNKPQSGEEEDKSKSPQEKNKEDQGQSGEDKQQGAKDQGEEKPSGQNEGEEAQPSGEEDLPEGADEDKEKAQAQEEQGGEETGKSEEKQEGLVAYQGAQKDPAEGTEMTEQEAKMLLEGYKGEEATGRMIKMRRKSADIAEPAKDW